jgi:hypothetical protein
MCMPSRVITSMLEASTPVWSPVPRAPVVYAVEFRVGESRRSYPMAITRRGGTLSQEVQEHRLETQVAAGQQVVDVNIAGIPRIRVALAVKSGSWRTEQSMAAGQSQRKHGGLVDERFNARLEKARRLPGFEYQP